MPKKFYLDKVEIMITNICNLNCTNCNRYNNFTFSGFRTWEDSKLDFERWAEQLDVGHWVIIGGEPTTNKDFREWIAGIHNLWPNSTGHLETNGTLLSSSDRELYNLLKSTNGKVHINIGLHNESWREKIKTFALDFLEGPVYQHSFKSFEDTFIQSYNDIKSDTWAECKSVSDWYTLDDAIKEECETVYKLNPENLRIKILDDELSHLDIISIGDKNKVRIDILSENEFYQSSIIHDLERGSLTLHNNDIVESHTHCMKRGDCFQLIDGGLFKCPVALALPQFEKQFPIDISEDDRKIIHSYKSANLSMSATELTDWFDNLKNPIDMCKFCSIDPTLTKFSAERKKIFFIKKKKLD